MEGTRLPSRVSGRKPAGRGACDSPTGTPHPTPHHTPTCQNRSWLAPATEPGRAEPPPAAAAAVALSRRRHIACTTWNTRSAGQAGVGWAGAWLAETRRSGHTDTHGWVCEAAGCGQVGVGSGAGWCLAGGVAGQAGERGCRVQQAAGGSGVRAARRQPTRVPRLNSLVQRPLVFPCAGAGAKVLRQRRERVRQRPPPRMQPQGAARLHTGRAQRPPPAPALCAAAWSAAVLL